MMMNRSTPAALCAAVALAWAPARAAQTAQPGYYVPPKLLTRGAASAPVAGPGSVVVQVFVKTDGTFDVQKVLRSTNHGDDAAALEIARRSTYRPARRGAAPEAAFYSFTLKFSGTSVAVGDSLPAVKPGGGVAKFVGLIRARKYAAAKSGLNDYLGAHPDDREAWLALGLANAYLGDWLPSAAAFDKGGTIPAKYQAVAASAYAQAAQAQFKSAPANAVADARRAVTLQPSAATYNTLGSAETGAGDYAAGAADLEKAKALASALPPKDRAQIAANLVYAVARRRDVRRRGARLLERETQTRRGKSESGGRQGAPVGFRRRARELRRRRRAGRRWEIQRCAPLLK
jgi:tetratricopeptide (TPR) repeat protein